MKSRNPWCEAELAQLRAIYPHQPTANVARALGRSESSINGKAYQLRLRKSVEYYTRTVAGRLRKGDTRGAKTRFKKGNTPHNKGVKGWQAGGDAHKTRFKPGHRPHTWKPIGSERLTKDGYLQRKVSDTGYPPRDWKMVHILLWEARNGPLPRGHMIVFRNGDKTDIRPDNLECISRADNMRRNTVHRLPKELAEICQLKGALQRQINKRG
ncbi:HNH endonuclease signature motif containing protein [Microbulbifer sp. SAOS-129_SWC]|uniref:HNH endonuclease signature motif containing protein n=1 Tax=Microbulbifer sp. SAOS-129_SWC TaxID=3145235 RepID=UPI003216EA82